MYNHKEIEQRILKFWQEEKIYEAAKKKNENGKKVYFLDGPPYTTGEIHVGTAWNKTLKDFYLRMMRMQGYNVWDRAGWDMHGLPITHKVLEKLKLEKQDIENFGVEKFIKLCEKFAVDNMNIMTEQFKKLGVWMDWENAYRSISPEFIEGVWWVIKRAHENKFLYQGKKTMHWCPSCATSLAKHELEYEEVILR
ncbi:class I tRNA ligase family protein [Candidatus Pacearchaeota archaeon]|nr:class I tRNA ligase family protein [Candidatus Pacearchaeota archaeon]